MQILFNLLRKLILFVFTAVFSHWYIYSLILIVHVLLLTLEFLGSPLFPLVAQLVKDTISFAIDVKETTILFLSLDSLWHGRLGSYEMVVSHDLSHVHRRCHLQIAF